MAKNGEFCIFLFELTCAPLERCASRKWESEKQAFLVRHIVSKPGNSQHLASHLQKNWRVVRKKGDEIENSLSTAKRDRQDVLGRVFS